MSSAPTPDEVNREAELEMYRRLTLEQGALLTAWLESTARPWSITQSFSESYTRLERKAPADTGKRAA